MNKGEISFHFQQKKYIWDADKKQFVKLRYPSDSHPPLKTFQSYNGLTTEKEIVSITEKYDLNRYVVFIIQESNICQCLRFLLFAVVLIFQSQHSLNCLRNMPLLPSLCSRSSVSDYGAWMNIGTTLCLLCSCWSYLNALWFSNVSRLLVNSGVWAKSHTHCMSSVKRNGFRFRVMNFCLEISSLSVSTLGALRSVDVIVAVTYQI